LDYKLADINDINTLVEFRKKQLIDEGQIPNTNIDNELRAYFLSIFEDENSVMFKSTKNGAIVAIGGVYFFQYPPSFKNISGKIAYVHTIYTKNEYRKQGIAYHILTLIVEETKKRGCVRMILDASEQAKSVYRKVGFIEANGYMKLNL